ncbi:MAG: fused MFS/spermidine synthase, partial [Phycisphaerae bacterium]|nr:fused MFS/spermidine synthase [Phycisphaerae bacterium]
MSDGPPADSPHDRPRGLVALAVGGLGVSAITAQLVLMREMLAAFCGNELVLGVLLGNWLLLTGLGSFLGRAAGRLKAPVTWLIVAQMLIAVLPPVQVLALRTLRDVVFVRGAMIGAAATAASSFVLLAPYCLISGFMLTAACSILSAGDPRAIGKVYLADSLGSIVGGALFGFVWVWWLDHFAALYVPAAVNLLLAAALAWRARRRVLAGVAVGILAGGVAVAASTDLDKLSTALQYPFQKVLFRGNSPYGRWVVTESAGQVNFIADGLPVVSTGNVQQAEETVHYAMAQRPGARRVLLIGGGLSGVAREVLKYPSAQVTCVELDPLAVELGRRFQPGALADPRITVVTTDGRLFVQRTDQRFDVVILDAPPPATAQVNRFYTA